MEANVAKRTILVVDDEKNIRLAMSRSLEGPDLEVITAVNGEEALSVLKERSVDLMILDLRMPGMDGMEVLRRVAHEHAALRVIIATAYGTVDRAVEAMKLGAVDFIEKPLTPAEVRGLVSKVLDRRGLAEERANTYGEYLELAKRHINERRFESALRLIEKAISLDSNRAEAFNLKGVLLQIEGDTHTAQKMYRVALQLDPTNRQARVNLDRSAQFPGYSGV